jgi:hypothetical protein
MATRYWLSGPRLFKGLVRPGISFTAADLRPKAAARAPASRSSPRVAVGTACG